MIVRTKKKKEKIFQFFQTFFKQENVTHLFFVARSWFTSFETVNDNNIRLKTKKLWADDGTWYSRMSVDP